MSISKAIDSLLEKGIRNISLVPGPCRGEVRVYGGYASEGTYIQGVLLDGEYFSYDDIPF